MFKDITKTGPVGLKGVNTKQDIDTAELIKQLHTKPNFITPEQAHRNIAESYGQITPMSTGADFGSSMWDKNILSVDEARNVANLRAENQPGLVQLGAGILKMGTTAVTTFLDGTVGGLIGLAQGTANALDNDPKTTFRNGLWNNDFNKWMAAAQEKMEEIAPNYYTEEQLNSPWYSAANLLSANFWGDKFLKNIGFTMGAMATMAIPGLDMAWIGKGISAVGRGLNLSNKALKGFDTAGKIVSRVGNTLLSANGEASIEAINAVQDNLDAEVKNLEDGRRAAIAQATEEYEKNRFRIPRGREEEFYNAYNQQLEKINADYDIALNEINKGLTNVGNSVYLANMLLLSLTNNLEFGKYLKGGYNTQKGFLGLEMLANGEKTESLAEFGKSLAKGQGALRVSEELGKNSGAKIVGGTVARMLEEGFEEGSQRLASDTAQMQEQARINTWAKKTDDSFYAKGINPDVTDDLVDRYKALHHAWNEAFGDISSTGWEEVFLGALTGGIGTFNIKKNREGKRRFGMQGGIWEEIADIKERRQDADRFVEYFNKQVQTPEFREKARHAITAMSLTEEMDKFLRTGDVLRYKNAELAQVVNDALFFKQNGALDAYMSFYEEMQNHISDDDLEQVKQQLKNLEGKSPYDGMTNEELRTVLQDKAKSTTEKIKKAVDIHDQHTLRYTERALKEARKAYEDDPDQQGKASELVGRMMLDLTAQATTIWDLQRRKDEIQKELDSLSDSDRMVRGVTNYTSAIDRIDKQIAARTESYKNSTSDLSGYVHKLKRYDEIASARRISKDAESLKNAVKGVTTLKELGDIYLSTDVENKQAVFDEAVAESEGETKTLLEKFKPFISVLNAYHDSINNAVEKVIPMSSEMTDEQIKEAQAAKLSWTLATESVIQGAIQDYVEDENVQYSKDSFIDTLNNLAESLKSVESPSQEAANTAAVIQGILSDVVEDLKKNEIAYKAAEPRKKKAEKKEEAKPKSNNEDNLAPPTGTESSSTEINIDFGETPKSEGAEEGAEREVKIREDEEPQKPRLYITDKEGAKSYANRYMRKRFGDGLDRLIELIDKENLTEEESNELNDLLNRTTDKFKELYTSNEAPKRSVATPPPLRGGEAGNTQVSEPIRENPDETDKDKEKAQEAGLSARANSFRKYAVGNDANLGIADGIGRRLEDTNPSSQQWYSFPFAEGIDYIVNNFLHKLMNIKGNDGKLKVQYAMYYPDGILATGVRKKNGKGGKPHILLVTEYNDEVKKILPQSDVNIQRNITPDGKYLIVGNYGYSTGQKKLEKAHKAISDRISKQRNDKNSDALYEVLDEGENGEWTNYIYDVSPGTVLRKNSEEEDNDTSLKAVLDNNNPTGAQTKDLKFTVVYGDEEEGTVTHRHIRVNPEDQIYDTEYLHHPGQVIVWMPVADGRYIAQFISPFTFNQLSEQNGQVYQDIMNTLRSIASTDPTDINQLEGLFGVLRNQLVFGSVAGNQIFYDTREEVDGQVNLNYNSIRIQQFGDVKDESALFLDGGLSAEEKLQSLINLVSTLNPRVAINTKTLMDNPEYYVNSNVLQVNLRNWGAVNAKAYMYVPNTDGTINTSPEPTTERKNQRAVNQVQGVVYIKGIKYSYMSDGTFSTNGMVGRNTVTDPNILAILEDVIQATNDNAVELPTGSQKVKYWVFGTGENLRIYAKTAEAGFWKLSPSDDKYKEVLDYLLDQQDAERSAQALKDLEALAGETPQLTPQEESEESSGQTPTTSAPEGNSINGMTTEGKISASELRFQHAQENFENLFSTFVENDANLDRVIELFGLDENGDLTVDRVISLLEANPHTKGMYMNVHSQEDLEQLLDKYTC